MRIKSNIVKTLKISFLSMVCISCSILSAFAAQNTLSSVEISDSDNGYQVVLRADKPTEVRKNVESRNEITLNLKDIAPVESVGTVYNNVPEIDSVIIQPETNNNTKIIIHGKNIAGTSVSFAPVIQSSYSEYAAANETKTVNSENEIELSQPIKAYTPIYNKENTLENNIQTDSLTQTALALSVDTAKDIKPYAKKAYNYASRLDKKILGMGALFLLIILMGIKGLLQNNKDDNMKIGLAQSLKDKEVSLRDKLNLANETQTLRNRTISGMSPSPSMNYGLKAYQNSQRNPYTSQITGLPKRPAVQPQKTAAQAINKNNIKMNKTVSGASLNKTASIPNQRPIMPSQVNTNTSSKVKNIDSLKFLESMTKIYERSGRADLANELKSNLNRVQLNR